MNEPRIYSEERRGGPSRPPLGEELLPPIEQPSAKFIIQLFVVPALIVMGIVGVWLLVSTLVRSATVDPDKLLDVIDRGPGVARWQRASELAEMLNGDRYAKFKRDPKLANHLAQILDREIDQSKNGQDSQEDAMLRYFLARALGRFEVNDGTDVLLKAADTKRTANDESVRNSAIEAIAVRAYNMQKHDPPEQLTHPDLEPTLVRLAGDEDATIRLKAIYALGQLGTPAAIEKIEVAVDDPDALVRYNAAIALAHRGNAKAVNTLAEMLDLAELTKVAEKPEKSDQDQMTNDDPGFRHAVIIASALDAAHALARQNPQADLSNVLKALDELVHADPKQLQDAHVPPRMISDADHALEMLKAKR